MNPSVGILIVTYNSAADIIACLESVSQASAYPLHVVVVDNASTDGAPALVASSFPDVTLIQNSANRYYAAANNQGLAKISADYILLLNPDVIMPVGSIDTLVRILAERTQDAAVAPKLVGHGGQRQRSLREFPGFDTLWYDLLGLSFLFPHSRRFGRWRMGYFDGSATRDVKQPMASCLLIRREAIDAVGAFDERYPMFFNDVDWCRRAYDAGWHLLYTPDVVAFHRGGASTRQRKVRMIWMSHIAYLRYLRQYESHGFWRQLALWISVSAMFFAALARTFWWGRLGTNGPYLVMSPPRKRGSTGKAERENRVPRSRE